MRRVRVDFNPRPELDKGAREKDDGFLGAAQPSSLHARRPPLPPPGLVVLVAVDRNNGAPFSVSISASACACAFAQANARGARNTLHELTARAPRVALTQHDRVIEDGNCIGGERSGGGISPLGELAQRRRELKAQRERHVDGVLAHGAAKQLNGAIRARACPLLLVCIARLASSPSRPRPRAGAPSVRGVRLGELKERRRGAPEKHGPTLAPPRLIRRRLNEKELPPASVDFNYADGSLEVAEHAGELP